MAGYALCGYTGYIVVIGAVQQLAPTVSDYYYCSEIHSITRPA